VAVILGSSDTSGGAVRRFGNKKAEFWREEGGGEERGDVVELSFLKKQNRRSGELDLRPDIISLLTHTKTANVPAIQGDIA
jgi:hypothetical protein